MEQWKDIVGYEGYYQVSDLGNVKSIDRLVSHGDKTIKRKGKLLKFETASNGYSRVRLCKDGKAIAYLVHRLVAIHFIDNPNNLPVVNHGNGIKSDNEASNLEWSTQQDNIIHSVKSGLANNVKKKNVKSDKPRKKRVFISKETKEEIRKIYIPYDDNYGAKAISKMFGISEVAVFKIVSADS